MRDEGIARGRGGAWLGRAQGAGRRHSRVWEGSRKGGGSSCASPYPPIKLTILEPTPTDQSRPPPQKAKTTVDKVPKMNPYLLAAAGLAVSGLLSLMLVIPALIFFPVTIFCGIVRTQ